MMRKTILIAGQQIFPAMQWLITVVLVCNVMLLTSCNSDDPVEPQTYSDVPLVIFDTDMGSSTDDLFALEMLYHYQELGRCKLLGIVVNWEGEANAVFADVMNTYFGHGDVPIGLIRDGIKNPRVFVDFAKIAYEKDDNGNPMFRRTVTDYSTLPDGYQLYRQLLAGQPDHSVSIISVGFITCLAQLLQSGADEYSSLSGVELVRQKVKGLYIMAGNFSLSNKPEYNLANDITSSSAFFRLWPADVGINFSPSEVGSEVYYQPKQVVADISWTDCHPIKQIYMIDGLVDSG